MFRKVFHPGSQVHSKLYLSFSIWITMQVKFLGFSGGTAIGKKGWNKKFTRRHVLRQRKTVINLPVVTQLIFLSISQQSWSTCAEDSCFCFAQQICQITIMNSAVLKIMEHNTLKINKTFSYTVHIKWMPLENVGILYIIFSVFPISPFSFCILIFFIYIYI